MKKSSKEYSEELLEREDTENEEYEENDEYDEYDEYDDEEEDAPRKKSKLGKVVLILLLIFLLLIGGGIFGVMKVLDLDKEEPVSNEQFVEKEEKEDNGEHLKEFRSSNDLSEHLKSWSDMTEDKNLMRSDDVINFLIIGCDKSEYNADVIMLVSLNKATKKIYLTSVMRDCYTYIPTSTESRFAKINSAYGIGGADKLIETVQKDFKIKIDYYASVNFETFTEIVDVMGGIDLNVPPYVADAIGNGCPSGNPVKLSGKYALSFVRVRKCDPDGDVSRTRRQREFINAVIDRSRELKLSELVEVFNIILKYVRTDCPTSQLISLATQGIISKWYAYDIISNSYPLEEHRMDYIGDSWVWIVDYPAAAQKLQTMIFGKTNINLGSDRISAIDIVKNQIAKKEN